jgi:transcriptional regulator with XRE-family HTH domain
VDIEQPGLLPVWICGKFSPGNLRRLRHAKGMSQNDLAYEAQISRSYLSQLEKGAFYASLKIIGKLAEALDIEPAELLKSARQ